MALTATTIMITTTIMAMYTARTVTITDNTGNAKNKKARVMRAFLLKISNYCSNVISSTPEPLYSPCIGNMRSLALAPSCDAASM